MIMVEYDRSHNQRSQHYLQQHRPASHLQHLDHQQSPYSTPSPPHQYSPLPAMNSRQQHQSVRPTPTSYPSPSSYSTPAMAAYTYTVPGMDMTGRQSPHYSQPQVSLPSVSLPPMRINPPAQLPPPSMGGMGSPLPPPNPLPYYQIPPPNAQHITSSPMHQGMRGYPIATVPAERIMSGGRHKKEIKRRTKTGCLTCRKRRIKCDEGHPTCKNCQKSKRECMGYDPIFKSQPGPAPIQPAPQMAGSVQQAPPMPQSMPQYVMPNQAVAPVPYVSMATAGSSPASSIEPYDYSIDPALEAAVAPVSSQPASTMGMVADAQPVYSGMKRSYDRVASPFSGVDPMLNSQMLGGAVPRSPPYLDDPTMMGSSAKRIKIDDLLTAHQPRHRYANLPSPPTTDPNVPMDVKTLYEQEYAPGLDDLLDTKWFSTKGFDKLMAEGSSFFEAVSSLFAKLKLRGGTYLEEQDDTIKQDAETEVFWRSMEVIFGIKADPQQQANGTSSLSQEDGTERPPVDYDAQQVLMRIQCIRALITGQVTSIARPAAAPKTSTEQNGGDSVDFWELIRRYVGNPRATMTDMHACNALLVEMHNFFETHDPNRPLTPKDIMHHILTSIAEVTFLSQRLIMESTTSSEASLEKVSNRKNLIQRYIENIALASRHEYNGVLRRVCGRAVGLWREPIDTQIAV